MVAYATFVYRAAVMVRDYIGGDSDNSTIVKDIEDMITFHIELANVRRGFKRFFNTVVLNHTT